MKKQTKQNGIENRTSDINSLNSHSNKKHKNMQLLFLVALVLILGLLTSIGFVELTGFASLDYKGTILVEEFNLSIKENYTEINLNRTNISGISINGEIIGQGRTKVILNINGSLFDVIDIDTNTSEGLNLITGYAIKKIKPRNPVIEIELNESTNETTDTNIEINSSQNISEEINESISENISIVIDEENNLTNNSSANIINETNNTIDENTSIIIEEENNLTNNTSADIINETNNTIDENTSIVINEENNLTNNTSADIINETSGENISIILEEEILNLENISQEIVLNETYENEKITEVISGCVETCNLEIINENISLIIILEGTEFKLNSIEYKILEENNAPIQIKVIDDIVLNKFYELNASEYFIDPDEDELIYDSSNIESINVSVKGEIIRFESNTPGEYELHLYATDGSMLTTSNRFNISVVAPEEYVEGYVEALELIKEKINARFMVKTKEGIELIQITNETSIGKIAPTTTNIKGKDKIKIIDKEKIKNKIKPSKRKQRTFINETTKDGNIIEIKQEVNNYKAVDLDETGLNNLIENKIIEEIIIDQEFAVLIEESKNITNATTVIAQGFNGKGQTICILDTGVNTSVLGVTNITGYNFIDNNDNFSDEHGHGTKVAYVSTRIANESKYVIAKVVSNNGIAYSSDIIAGLEYCEIQEANIISISLGAGRYEGYCDEDLVAQKINNLSNNGILTVVASGNDGYTNAVSSPACARESLAIGASTKTDEISTISNYNNATLLVAPGESINTKDQYGVDVIASGTSMSTPIVAGITAIISENKTINNTELKELLIHTGKVVEHSERYFSRVNAYNALTENITNNFTPGNLSFVNGSEIEFSPLATTIWVDDFSDGEWTNNWTLFTGTSNQVTVVSEELKIASYHNNWLYGGNTSWGNYTYTAKLKCDAVSSNYNCNIIFAYGGTTDFLQYGQRNDEMRIFTDSYSDLAASSSGHDIANDVWVWYKVVLSDDRILARHWNVSDSEPSTWDFNISTPSDKKTGAVGVVAHSLSASYFDDVTVTQEEVGEPYDANVTATKFNGSTTNFDSLTQDLNNNIVLEIADYGKIEWNDELNVSNQNYDSYVNITQNNISVAIGSLHSTHNSSANLSLYGLSYLDPTPYKDGSICTDCTRFSYNGSTMTFNASGFSSYTAVESVKTLEITDPITAIPESVEDGDNISILFNFLSDSVNVTTGITTNNVTINGEEATIIGSGLNPFENFTTFTSDLGDWASSGDTECSWARDVSGTGSGSTGPCSGSATCTVDAGYDNNMYSYVETSSNACDGATDHAYLTYTGIDLDNYSNTKISFAYNMYGAEMGQLNVQIDDGAGGWDTLWNISGNQGTSWYTKTINFSGYSSTRNIRFDYYRNGFTSFTGDVALDVLNISGSSEGQEVVYIPGVGWQVNVTVPSGLTGDQDLFVNATHNSVSVTDTESNAVSYGWDPLQDISTTPNTQGFGQNITIQASTAGSNGVSEVWVGITTPQGTETNYSMSNYTADTWTYNYTNYINGTYNYTIYANNTEGSNTTSSINNFSMNVNFTIEIKTLKDSYTNNDIINITDPPDFLTSLIEQVIEVNEKEEQTEIVEETTTNIDVKSGNRITGAAIAIETHIISKENTWTKIWDLIKSIFARSSITGLTILEIEQEPSVLNITINESILSILENSDKVDEELLNKIRTEGKARTIIKTPEGIKIIEIEERKTPQNKKEIQIQSKKEIETQKTKDEITKVKEKDIKDKIKESKKENRKFLNKTNKEGKLLEIKQETKEFKSIENIDLETLLTLIQDEKIESISLDQEFTLLIEESKNITRANEVITHGLGGSGQTICILDTGANSEVLGINITGYNFVNDNTNISDNHGHGTKITYVASRIANESNYIIAKVVSDNGTAHSSDIIAGLEYCEEQGANIISISLGAGQYNGYCDEDPVAQKINDLANNNETLTIIASGNDGHTNAVTSPACAREGLAVAASTKTDNVWINSNYNNATILLAPGENIETKDEIGNNVLVSGTSISAPIAASIIAIGLENKTLNTSEIKELAIQTGIVIEENARYFSRIDAPNFLNENITNNLSAENMITVNGSEENFTTLLSACGTLSTADTTYTLTQNISSNDCIAITASGVTLDCDGYTISSTPSYTSTIKITESDVSILNCNVVGGHAIDFSTGSYDGIVNNSNFSSATADVVYFSTTGGGERASFTNSIFNGTSTSGPTFRAENGFVDIVIDNCDFEASTARTFYMRYGSGLNSFTMTNSRLYQTGNGDVMQLEYFDYAIMDNVNVSTTGSGKGIYVTDRQWSGALTLNNVNVLAISDYALQVLALSINAANSSFESGGNVVALGAWSGGSFYNNSINSTDNNDILISMTRDQHTLWWNTFGETSALYVSDSIGSNNYYKSISGHNEGNYWYNIGGLDLVETGDADYGSGFQYSASGTDHPYNNANSGGKVTATNVVDQGPLIPGASGPNSEPNTPTVNIQSIGGTNATSEDLNCSATLIDNNSDDMNLTIVWYNNTNTYSTTALAGPYSDGTLFNNTISNSITNAGDNWSCAIIVDDGTNTSEWGYSENITILTPFISTWTTSLSGTSNSTQITLPLEASGNYNFAVNWGDSSSDNITEYNDSAVTHDYSSSSTYTVTITGTIEGWRFNNGGDKSKIIGLSQWGPLKLGNNTGYFYGAINLDINATDILNLEGTTNLYEAFRSADDLITVPSMNDWDTSEVTNMSGMFSYTNKFNQNISGWNTSKVTDMSNMFNRAYEFNHTLNNWDTSKVTNMSNMFNYMQYFNHELNNWDTSNVTDMSSMFKDISDFNQNISGWNTSKVTNMNSMFEYAVQFNQNLTNWDTSSVTNMKSMFEDASYFNGNLSGWNTSQVINMTRMFNDASNFNQNISEWDTSKVTDMNSMFEYANIFNQSLNSWNVSKVTDMSYMFGDASKFNQPLNNWDTSKVTNMDSMFRYAYDFNQSLTNWDTSNVIDMNSMFYEASSFNQNISGWNTSKVTDMSYMFGEASDFNQNISGWNTSKVTDMSNMFEYAYDFNQTLNNWDISNVKYMNEMFEYAYDFNQPLNNWNTSKVTDMDYMFYEANKFNQPLNNWDTSKVTNMGDMFDAAYDFNQNISGWDTSNVTDMNYMFYEANNFNQNINGWNTSNVTDMTGMFGYASNFNQPLNNWDTSKVTNMPYMFTNATSFDQDISNWNVSSVSTADQMFKDVTLSVLHYSNLLINWNELNLQTSVTFDGGNSKFNPDTAANAKTNMDIAFSWTITDGGPATAPTISFENPTTNEGSFSQRTITVNVSAISNEGSIVNITANLFNSSGDLIASNTSTDNPFYWVITNLDDENQIYYLNATTIDNQELINKTETRNITLTPYAILTISSVKTSKIGTTSSTIIWDTDEISNSTINYGTTTSLGSATNNITTTTTHQVKLSSLANNTLYYYNVSSCKDNECITEGPYTFKTAIPANYSSMSGSTTEFNSEENMSSVCQSIVENSGFGKIQWNECINASAANIDDNIIISRGSVYMNTASMHSSFNSSANLTMVGLNNIKQPAIYKDGSLCSDCEIINWNQATETLIFNVTSFSNYTAAEANQSKIVNNGTTNSTFRILMKTQYNNSGTWIDEDVVYNSSHTLTTSNQIKLDTLWNPTNYAASSLDNGNGTYRVWAAITDPNGNILNNTNGTQILATYNFIYEISSGNNAPTITNVQSLSNQNPTEGTINSVNIKFTVSDTNGHSDLNHSAANVSFIKDAITRTGTCSNNTIDSTTTNYSCSVNMNYYDLPGTWTINVSAEDNSAETVYDDASSFTYNSLYAFELTKDDISFASATVGINNINASDDPQVLSNTGNGAFTYINLTSYELSNGVDTIGSGNFTINATNDAKGINTIGTILIPDASLTVSGTQNLFLWVDIPSGISSGSYTTNQTTQWIIEAYN